MGEVIAFPPQERPEDDRAEPLWREAVGRELREERHRQPEVGTARKATDVEVAPDDLRSK